MGSFFHTLKTELIHGERFRTREEAKLSIFEYVEVIAVGHKILIMSYQILKYKVSYKELGIDCLDRRRKDKVVRSYIKRLKNLGYDVLLQEVA